MTQSATQNSALLTWRRNTSQKLDMLAPSSMARLTLTHRARPATGQCYSCKYMARRALMDVFGTHIIVVVLVGAVGHGLASIGPRQEVHSCGCRGHGRCGEAVFSGEQGQCAVSIPVVVLCVWGQACQCCVVQASLHRGSSGINERSDDSL